MRYPDCHAETLMVRLYSRHFRGLHKVCGGRDAGMSSVLTDDSQIAFQAEWPTHNKLSALPRIFELAFGILEDFLRLK